MSGAANTRLGRVVDGKYRLAALMAESKRTLTYRAEHTGIRRAMILKTIPDRLPADGPDAARLVREARAAGGAPHRNVQSVVDSGTDEEGRPFIVYEELVGESLADVLANHPDGVEPKRASKLMMQILEGLMAIHRGGVVHRALWPGHIDVVQVRGGDELVKICGFDDAVFLEEALAADRVPEDRCPAAYQAPEVRRGPPAVDPRADVYSAGMVMRALMCGGTEASRPIIDTARRAIERATATNPDERFPDAELFLHAVSLMMPTPSRPARDDMPTPEDPLLADLHYLQLRRTTRAGERIPARGEAKVDLMPVLLTIEAIYRRLGSHWDQLVQRVPEVDRLLPGAGNTQFNLARGVPVELVARILGASDEIAGRGDLGLLAEIGETVARRGIRRIYPLLPDPITPEALIDSFQEIWPRITRQGSVVVLERGRTSARVAIRGQLEPSLELCAVVAGLLRGCLRMGGHDQAEVYTTACQALGDAACVYGLSWSHE